MVRKRTIQPGAVDCVTLLCPARNATRECGFSLHELLFVVVIIGLIATVMTPAKGPGDGVKLDLAAAEIADALRFARSEALRLGVARGVRAQALEKRVRVFSMNTLTSPATLVYDVYHPVDKKLYDRDLGLVPYNFSGSIVQTQTFRGTCDAPENIYFDAVGTPWCADPETVLVEKLVIALSLGSASRSITVHGINGRVTVQ